MDEREELAALRRLAELEAKASGVKPMTQEQKLARARSELDPTEGTGFGQQTLEGAGKFFYDLGRGTKQVLGINSTKDIDETKRLDAPLMEAGRGGGTGKALAASLATLPLAYAKGINTVAGALGYGGALGALEPTGEGDSRAKNMAMSGALTAAFPAARTAFQTGKALVEPLYQGGRENIVARTLERFGANPDELRSAAQYVPGSNPTAAEATGNAGLATLERGAQSSDPMIAKAFAERQAANAEARMAELRKIAQDDAALTAAKATRDAEAKTLYEQAFAEKIQDTPWLKGQFTQLMKRPAFVDALKEGQEIAMNEGVTWAKGAANKGKIDESEAVKILHYTKKALDDKIGAAEGNAQRALIEVRDKLLSVLESNKAAPSYGTARQAYATASKPVNQMEIGQYLRDKMQPALNDFGTTGRTKAEQYALALRNADETARKATGFGGARMADVMEPAQMDALQNIGKDLARKAAAENAAKGVGSNTAQNLASQNILRQMAGPLGMPTSWAEAVPLAGTFGRAAQFGLKTAEPRIQERLAAALLNPGDAAQLMDRLSRNPKTQALAEALMQYLPATGAGYALSQGQ